MQDFFTWGFLSTYAGATAGTVIIVQFLKIPLNNLTKIITRLIVYAVSLIILLAATFFTGGLTIEVAGMCVLNAVLVAMAAMGTYASAIEPFVKKDDK